MILVTPSAYDNDDITSDVPITETEFSPASSGGTVGIIGSDGGVNVLYVEGGDAGLTTIKVDTVDYALTYDSTDSGYDLYSFGASELFTSDTTYDIILGDATFTITTSGGFWLTPEAATSLGGSETGSSSGSLVVSGTALSTGTRRYVGIDLYEVTASPNTADYPVSGAAKATPSWVKVGQLNRFNMFNGALYQQTIQTGGPLTVSVVASERVNAVAVLNCDAAEAVVTMTDADDNEVYTRTVSLTDNGASAGWYEYFFGSSQRFTEFVLTDLPTYAGATITLTLSSGETGDVKCGAFIFGDQDYLGVTGLYFTIRNRFFSRRERSIYGDFLDLLKRPVAREGTFKVLVKDTDVSRVLNLISIRETVPTLYIGDEGHRQTIIFGFPDEPEAEQITKQYATLNLTILGQT